LGSVASLEIGELAGLFINDSVETSVSTARATAADGGEGEHAATAVRGAALIKAGITDLVGLYDAVTAGRARTELLHGRDQSGSAGGTVGLTSNTEAVAFLAGIEVSVTATSANAVDGLEEVSLVVAGLAVGRAVQVVLDVADLSSINLTVTALSASTLGFLVEARNPSRGAAGAVGGALGRSSVTELSGIEVAVSAQGTTAFTVWDVVHHADALFSTPLGKG